MATHSKILAWEISWTEEPGGPQSMGSQSRTRLTRLSRHGHIEACRKIRTQMSDMAEREFEHKHN